MAPSTGKIIKKTRATLELLPIYLDTETTGLDGEAEICEISILDSQGEPILDTLVKPTQPIPWEAERIHGISDEMVANAPSFAELLPQINIILKEAEAIIIYNKAFDTRLLRQSAQAHGMDFNSPRGKTTCAMIDYAAYVGQWNDKRKSYRWHSLNVAASQQGITTADLHRAKADAELTRLVYISMAQLEELNVPRDGYQLYLFDLDSTLAKRYTTEILPNVKEWFAANPNAKTAIVTNQGGVGLRRWMEEANFGEPEKFPLEADIHERLWTITKALGGDILMLAAFAYQTKKGQWAPLHNYQGCKGNAYKREWRKPQPEMLLEAMYQRQAQPRDTLMIGDSTDDQAAAAAAGVSFMWARDFFGWED